MNENPIPGSRSSASPLIVVDGIFFQRDRNGIARVWRSFLEQWTQTGFAAHVVVLDRNRTAPRFAGIRYHDVPEFDARAVGREMMQLERWCRELDADLFVSTYYTAPTRTPSLAMVYDMIFEVQSEHDRGSPDQEEKALALLHADHVAVISRSTGNDVQRFYPFIPPEAITVVHCGVDSAYQPVNAEKIAAARAKFGLSRPYFLLVGTRDGLRGYKNAVFPVRALDRIPEAAEWQVACLGGEPTLGPLADFRHVEIDRLSFVEEADLVALYSGAEALLYPSRYEGFGLPILEAMACGCPVITCRNSSIPEVAGDAAVYVEDGDLEAMAAALRRVREPAFRAERMAAGLKQAALFSWKKAAAEMAEVLLRTAANPRPKDAREMRMWEEFRGKEERLAPIILAGRRALAGRGLELRLGRYTLRLGISRARKT